MKKKGVFFQTLYIIENKIFSISFSSSEKLTIEQFSNIFRNEFNEQVAHEQLYEKINLPEKYQRLIDKFFILYETEFSKFRTTDTLFYIPVAEKETIHSEIKSFANDYARMKYPDSNFYFFSSLMLVLLWIFIIPFSTYMFYKYFDNYGRDISHSNINENYPSTALNDSIDQITFPTEPQSPQPLQPPANTIQPVTVKINEISETDIQKQLNMTAIQAKMILAERDMNGVFHNFSDFLKRTGLSERMCNQFKERLDFYINNQSNTPSGRLLDI